MSNVVQILRDRGLFEDMTSPDVEEALSSPLTVYAGFDPSSDSLQAGNLVTIMALSHFQRCGHKVIAVVGGATGMIGDPSGKMSERQLLSEEQVVQNAAGIRENLERFLDFSHPTAPARIENNIDWLGRFSFIDFLRDVGKHFRMGAMLGRESVRARLGSETGMSFTEFSYQLLQAYDFMHLHDAEGCRMQIGGSDQWGNITAGVELLRRVRGVEAFGLTIPLVCDSAGQKFGKSEGNAVYLDKGRTPVFDFYQFFVRATDADAVSFLKIFTYLPLSEIQELEEEIRTAPEKRAAQKKLAEEVTRLVHGEEGLLTAQRASAVLFGGPLEGLSVDDLLGVFANVPATELTGERVMDCPAVDLAAETGLCRSKGEARRLIQSGGLYLNNTRVADAQSCVVGADVIGGRILVLRSGKKNYHLVKVI